MATKVVATYEGGAVRVEYDYDDSTRRITAVRVINNTSEAIYVEAQRDSDGLLYTQRFPGNETTFISIPTGPAGRLQLTVDPQGRLTGVTIRSAYPWP